MGFGKDLANGLVSAIKGENSTPYITTEMYAQGSPLLNRMKASSETRNFLSEDLFQDPLYIRFKIFFNFYTSEGLLANESIAGTNSALMYFKRIGDTARYELLKQFISDLSMISSQYSFLFDEITELGEILNLPMGEFCPADQKINIRTKETLDMKIQGLIENYRKIVWDWDRKVYVLPKNLRRFGMHIYIYPMNVYQITAEDAQTDIKKLFPCFVVNYQPSSGSEVKKVKPQNYVIASPDSFNHVLYRFDGCEFLLNNSGANFLSSVLNTAGSEPTTNLISIHPMKHEIEGDITNWWHTGSKNMKSLASLVVGAENQSLVDNLKDLGMDTLLDIASPITDRANSLINKIGIDFSKGFKENLVNIGTGALMDAASYVATNASAYVKNKINGLFYGNVYGFSFDTLASGIGSINGIMTTARNSLGNNRNQGSSVTSRVGTNVYAGDVKPVKPEVPDDNIYNSTNRYNQL